MHVTVVTTYVLILIGVAVHKSRTVKSADDFMIAGRSVPVYMLVATLVCTWIGSGSLFGTAGLTFRTGLSELWFSAGAWVGILVIYMIAARVRRIAQYTLTDLLEKRYSQLAKVLGTITIVIAYMVIAGYQFKGGGRFISILSDGSITPETGMIIAAFLIVGFTVLAGMVSIVSIDIFNGSIPAFGISQLKRSGAHGEHLDTVRRLDTGQCVTGVNRPYKCVCIKHFADVGYRLYITQCGGIRNQRLAKSRRRGHDVAVT